MLQTENDFLLTLYHSNYLGDIRMSYLLEHRVLLLECFHLLMIFPAHSFEGYWEPSALTCKNARVSSLCKFFTNLLARRILWKEVEKEVSIILSNRVLIGYRLEYHQQLFCLSLQNWKHLASSPCSNFFGLELFLKNNGEKLKKSSNVGRGPKTQNKNKSKHVFYDFPPKAVIKLVDLSY